MSRWQRGRDKYEDWLTRHIGTIGVWAVLLLVLSYVFWAFR